MAGALERIKCARGQSKESQKLISGQRPHSDLAWLYDNALRSSQARPQEIDKGTATSPAATAVLTRRPPSPRQRANWGVTCCFLFLEPVWSKGPEREGV
jgi:hypothetical protein